MDFGIIAVFFNPIIPIHFKRDTWQLIDLIVAVLFIISFFVIKKVKNNKLVPLCGAPMVMLIRKIIGKNDKEMPPDFTIMGLSEATIITVTDAYFCYKSQMSYLSNEDIFRRILKARGYDSETEEKILKNQPQTLVEFIKYILDVEEQGEYLSERSINNLIEKYCKIRGVKQETVKKVKK